MRSRLGAAVGVAVLLAAGMSSVAAPETPRAVAAAAAVGTVPRPDHVVVLIDENHSGSGIIGNPNAPYITSLATNNANFTQSFALTHPSQPNYIALFSGSTQGVTDDSCPHTFATPSLGDALLGAGRSFVGYSESQPSAGFKGCGSQALYAAKHNPWVDFPAIPDSSNQPFTAFPTDYSTLPDVSFVIPNLQNDMHDGTVAQGDAWVESHMSGYIDWAKQHNSLFILTFDEDDNTAANRIPTIFAGQQVVPGSYDEHIDHYNVLRTIEDAHGLTPLGASASSQPILDVWAPPTGDPPPVAAFTSSCQGAACSFDGSDSTDDTAVAGWSWSFGDGATGTGSNASHSFASSGTYQVTLRVTDDQGATSAPVTHPVSVTVPAGTPFVSDTFARTVTNGLGTANVGGAWSTVGAASAFSVSPGAAKYRLGAGSQLTGFLPAAAKTDTDVLAAVSLSAVPVGGAVYLSVHGRRVSANNEYDAKVLVNADRSVTIRVNRLISGAETVLAGAVKVTGLTYTAGMVLNIRVQVTGTSPTTVRARTWAATGTEPTTWQVSGTDSTAALQVAGTVGLTAYMSAAVSPNPMTVSLNSIVAKSTSSPPNQPPVAAFTFSCQALACSFDGTGSSDDVGVTSWAWVFGDGGTGTGSSPSHTFPGTGSYSVQLTVRDASTAADAVTHPVSVTAPTGTSFVSDAFARTVTNGLGSAPVGGAYSIAGSASAFSVAPGAAAFRLGTAGTQIGAFLPAAPRTDADVLTAVALDKVPVGGPVYVTVQGRRVSSNNEYDAKLVVNADRSVTIRVTRLIGGAETALAGPVKIAGITYAAAMVLNVRLQVTGTSPTTVRARAWAASGTEPSTWQVSGTDGTAALQVAGSVGLTTYLSSAATNAPVTVRFSGLTAKPTGAA